MNPAYALILAIYLLSSLPLEAQEISFPEAEQYADKLVEKEILTSHGGEVLLKELQEKKIETDFYSGVTGTTHAYYGARKEAILQFCALVFYEELQDRLNGHWDIERNIKPEDSVIDRPVSMFSDGRLAEHKGCVSSKRSTVGQTVRRTLEDIRTIGLITDLVYTECQHGLKDSSIVFEPGLFLAMAERTIYYTHYEFNKREQEVYVDGLVTKGILTGEERSALLNTYKPFELKTLPEILSFSSHFLAVDVSQVPATPDKIYPVIFDSIRRLLPDFRYSNLHFDLIESKEEDLIRQDLKIGFTVDAISYSHIFFYHYRHEVPDTTGRDQPFRVNDAFNKAVNQWLTDIGSVYRLYTVDLSGKNGVIRDFDKVGLLLLKKGQAEQITGAKFLLSEESFDTPVSGKNIKKR